MPDGIIFGPWSQDMKLKKSKFTSQKELRKRAKISFTMLVSFFIIVIAGFLIIQTGGQSDGTPKLLRHSFMWNEEVWKIISSNKRQSDASAKINKEKEPRINGLIGLKSSMDPENYKILVTSGTQKEMLPISAFKVIPKTNSTTEFRCIEGWSDNFSYSGAKFSDFLEFYRLGKKSDGKYYSYVGLETPDGEYYVSIDMESMLHSQTILTYEMNDRPLSFANGAPLRLIIPVKYGIKSLKRIGKIVFSDVKPKDYWAERGYDWYSGL